MLTNTTSTIKIDMCWQKNGKIEYDQTDRNTQLVTTVNRIQFSHLGCCNDVGGSETKVADLDVIVRGQENVHRLQVSVNHTLLRCGKKQHNS